MLNNEIGSSNIKGFIIDNWEVIKSTVRNEYELSEVSYNTWILPLVFHDFDEENNQIIILIPSDQSHALKYITSKYALFFKVTISEFLDDDLDVKFILPRDTDISNVNDGVIHSLNYENTNLNSKYLFESFVIGSNNRFAHSASLAVAESPGITYNPLYIYSGAGLGKTHLIHSIGHFILSNNPNTNTKVLYITSEQFTNEVIASIRSGNAAKMTKLREKYRTVDVLLLDDVQFIIGKESTQEEFFHTFNALHSAKKQIILTSDKPPKDLETLEERLRNRFAWGLICDMQPPDYETRMAILQKYAATQNKKVDVNILEYIAKNVTSNIRELEGALNKVLAFSKIEKQELNMYDIEKTLKDIIYNEKQEITPQLIINIVAEHCNVNPSDITSKRKNSEFVQPRQIVMYLCRQLTNNSYDQIAKILGKRDHTTIIYGDKKIQNDLLTNDELKNKIENIKKIINPV